MKASVRTALFNTAYVYVMPKEKHSKKKKKKQTHRYREQTSNQWGERRGRGNIRVGGKERVTHSSTLAWKIPWMEGPGRLQSMGSQRVGHDWVTLLSLFTFMHWRRKWQPTPVFLPGESQRWRRQVGCRLWGCTVGHDWSDLAAAAYNYRKLCV